MSAQLSLADTMPPMKRCLHCGAAYDAESWARLPFADGKVEGREPGRMTDGAGGELELRNCPCGQTMAIAIPRIEPAAPSDPRPNSPEDLGWTRPATTRAPGVYEIPTGTPQRACNSCRRPIFWIVTPAGARMPVDPDGKTHFATCPNAAAHRKPRKP